MNPYAEMLADLESNRLTVELVPARVSRHEMHFVRVAVGMNPLWYRNLCAAHPGNRRKYRGSKAKTRIRRIDITRILVRLAMGLRVKSGYADEIRRIAENWEKSRTFGKSERNMTLKIFGNKS